MTKTELRKYYANRPGRAVRPSGEEVDDNSLGPGERVTVPSGEHQGKKVTILQVRRQEQVGEGEFADVFVCSLNLAFFRRGDQWQWARWSNE